MEAFLILNKNKILTAILLAIASLISFTLGKQSLVNENPVSDNDLPDLACNLASDNAYFYFEVAGQVNAPGVYTSPKDALLVAEAIEMAGGYNSAADTGYVNKYLKLAVTVTPGEKIYVPAINEINNTDSMIDTQSGEDKLNINTASLAELDAIYGVGEVTAKKIIASRPYSNCGDIEKVSGINSTVKKNILAACQL